MFWRDPTDPAQREPRIFSILILANAVAYLQAIKEGTEESEFKSLYQILARAKVNHPSLATIWSN